MNVAESDWWKIANTRRSELIGRKHNPLTKLTEDEVVELRQLQELADRVRHSMTPPIPERLMTEPFKHKIGSFVSPAVMDDCEHARKMIVTARVTEEYASHTERYYICSHYKLGDYIRQRIAESELIVWKEKP